MKIKNKIFERLQNYSPVIVLTSSPDFEVMSLQVVCVPVVQSGFLHTLFIEDRAIVLKRDENVVHTVGVAGIN
jgi:hypothetical protein